MDGIVNSSVCYDEMEQQRSHLVKDGQKSVVAIVDASCKDIAFSILRELLQNSQLKPQDLFTILGVFQFRTPRHYGALLSGNKRRGDPNSCGGWNLKVLIEEDFNRNEDILHIRKLCEEKQIVFQMDIQTGNQCKIVAVDAAKGYQPTVVILDRHIKNKKYFLDNLKCDVWRMKAKNIIEVLRRSPIFRYEDMLQEEFHYNLPSPRHLFTLQIHGAKACQTQSKSDLPSHSGSAVDEDASMLPTNSKFITAEISSSSISECFICKYIRPPNFGTKLKAFDLSEIEAATNNFSSENSLPKGGSGVVYRGRLKDGQYIAVKQHKEAREKEFRSEVEVLSYARHKNLITLVGYCSQNDQRLLVYEYVCNGSLDKHLYNSAKPLPWHYRKKIAEGTARGLRYLHEECRGGYIVHRDMRPKHILVTHDFEPKIFGLARSQQTCEVDNETRVVGTFGYLAPEYAECGEVSTKTDVYSFGMVLLELITGRRALDRTLPGQSLLAWARPLLEYGRYRELVDPLLTDSHDVHEFYCMVHAAGLCLRKAPDFRPSMNQVVQILEGSMRNQLKQESPTESGSKSFIQIFETSAPARYFWTSI